MTPTLHPEIPRDLEAHQVELIVGKRGTGKSTAAKLQLAELLKRKHRAVAFDPHDEFSGKGRANEHVFLGPLADRILVDELIRNPTLLDDENLSLAVVPRLRQRDAAADFEDFADLIQQTGDLVALVEEVGLLSDYCRDALNTLATQSRHYGMPLVLIAQRMTQIPKTARTQASVTVSFLQTNPDDLDALVDLADGDKTLAARVSRLALGDCVVLRDSAPRPKQRKERIAA